VAPNSAAAAYAHPAPLQFSPQFSPPATDAPSAVNPPNSAAASSEAAAYEAAYFAAPAMRPQVTEVPPLIDMTEFNSAYATTDKPSLL